MESYSMYCPTSAFFHFVNYFESSMLIPVLVDCFFLLIRRIPMHVCTVICLFIHLLTYIWLSSLKLLLTKSLWTFLFKTKYGHLFLFIWDKYLVVKLLDIMIILKMFNFMRNIQKVSRVLLPLYTSTSSV